MSRKANLYVGRAGQMVVISEFLIRGWNVAVPEVDIGDDLLVIKDQNTALRVPLGDGCLKNSGQNCFSIQT